MMQTQGAKGGDKTRFVLCAFVLQEGKLVPVAITLKLLKIAMVGLGCCASGMPRAWGMDGERCCVVSRAVHARMQW